MTRPMTRTLETALGNLTAADRRTIVRLAAEPASPLLGSLLRGFAAEVAVLELSEAELLRVLAADARAEVEEMDAKHPYPPATGPSITFDPDA